MKKSILTIVAVVLTTLTFAQNQKVQSIIYKQQYTIAERDAMTLGADDRKQIYVVDTGVNEVQIWDGDSWETLGGGDTFDDVVERGNVTDNEIEATLYNFKDATFPTQVGFVGFEPGTSEIRFENTTDSRYLGIGLNSFKLKAQANTATFATGLLSANRTYFLPNKGGTFALLDDIVSIPDDLTLGEADTTSGSLTIAGNNTDTGGSLVIENPADDDTAVNDYSFETINGNLILKANGGTNGSAVPVFTVNSSTLQTGFGNYEFPRADGTAGQVLTTDGSGNVTFEDVSKSILTIQNSDRVLLAGASFMGGGARDFKDKSIVSMVSSLTDWTCEGYGNSGDTYLDLFNAINNNETRFGTTGIQDFNSTYILTNYEENDVVYWGNLQARYWRDVIQKTARTIKSIGSQPIFTSQIGNNAELLNISMVYDASIKEGVDFVDISSQGYMVNQDRYLPFWNNGHPGVRLNNILWQPMVDKLNDLERPNQSIKIFRNRPSFTVNADLLFSDNYERLQKWREISIGHRYTTDATIKYYDELDSGSLVSAVRDSEYLKLVRNENVEFQDKALIQVILPATAKQLESLKLILSDKTLTGYVRKYVDDTYDIPDGDNIGFRLDATPTSIVEGDTYTSDQVEYSGLTFTVVSYDSGILVCSADGAFSSGGLENGTLTRTSGTGDASLDYFGTAELPSSEFFTQAFEPYGEWELMTKNSDNDFEITDFYKYMDYDEIQFLIEDTGTFNLSDISVEYSYNGKKINKKIDNDYSLANPIELLGETNFDTAGISNWTNPDSKVPYTPLDSNTPLDTTSEVVELSVGESLSQDIVLKSENNEPQKIKVRLYARYFPDIFDSTDTFSLTDDTGNNPVHENSFDFAKLRLSFSRTAGALDLVYDFDSYVYMGWYLIEKEIYVQAPKDFTTYTFKVECLDKSIELSYISILGENNVEDVTLGPELFTNPTFDSDLSGWDVADAAVTWTSDYGGSARFADTGSRRLLDTGLSVTIGNNYRLTYEIKENSGSTSAEYFKGDAYVALPNLTVGTHSVDFVAGGTTIGIRNLGTAEIVFDNLSLKEILE
jgi:hypothetical protein